MKKLHLLVLLLVAATQLSAQYSPQWVTASPDYFKVGAMMAVDGNDNVVITGYRPGFSGAAHIYTRKIDPAGNLLWEQTDSSGVVWKFYKARWVNIDSQNNIYVSGYRYSGTSSEYTDTIVCIKYDPAGNKLWKREIPHIWPSSLSMRSELDADGNLYIGTVGINPGFQLIKINTNGNVLYNVSNASALNQNFNSMRLKNDRVVMTSYAYNGSQVSVCAFDTAGNFLWSTYFPSRGGADVEIDDSLNTYILTREQNLIAPASNYDIEIFKFNPSGAQVAVYEYDFGGGNDFATRMTLVNGKISVIGLSILPTQAYMDWITFQTDLNGNKLWDARYGFTTSNDEKSHWVTATPDGDVYVSGQGGPDTVSATGSSYLRYVTVKYRNGNTLWTDAHPYQGYVGVASALDSQCGLYVLGETYMTAIHYTDSCFTVSVPEYGGVPASEVTVFPNPAKDHITIRTGSVEESELFVYGIAGNRIMHQMIANESTLSLQELSSGMYFYEIRTPSGNVTGRFVKD